MIVLDELKDDDIPHKIDYLRNLFIEEKIIGFNKFSVFNEVGLNTLIMHMADCEANQVVVSPNNQHNGQERIAPEGYENEHKDFIWYNIHSDIAEVANPNLAVCRLIGMVMDVFTCSGEYGKTFFLDREKMLQQTPDHIREWMKQIHVVGLIGEKDTGGVNGIDWDGKRWPLRNMPGIISHPVTGIDNFAFTSYKHKVIAEDMSLESEYEEFIDDYFHDNSNWITWEWQEGKAIIWDNTNLLHTYSSGWKDGERVFTRLQGGFTVPHHKWGNL
jgi:hypothetical protein